MRKILITVVIVALIITSASIPSSAAAPIKVKLDKQTITFDVPPAMISGRTMVPLRAIFEAMGAQVAWDGTTQTVTGTKGSTTIVLKLNDKVAYVNSHAVKLDAPAKMMNSRVLVPTRFIAESLGASVSWDGATSTVLIDSSAGPIDPQVNLYYAGDPMLNYDYMVAQTDSDGDGLTDYEETNKYLTVPKKADSDGDGIRDGDWNERREYAYTILAKRELKAPFNSASLKDTFQDIRIISETKDTLVYEAVLYPYAKDVVAGDPNWKQNVENPAFQELLRPRKTTNWDAEMQKVILDSIPSSARTDLEVVQFLVPTFFDYLRVNPSPKKSNHPIDLFVDLRHEKPIIYNKTVWQETKVNPQMPDAELIDRILFAKSMFANRNDGACTENATYLTSVLRAAGIPARIIETNALLDHGASDQDKLLKNLGNDKIRTQLMKQSGGYYGHYYIEAYVGSRWIKINNNGKIFESNYIETYPGVFHIKADTFFDYADTAMVDIFKNYFPDRPYKLLALSDQLGVHYAGPAINMTTYTKPAAADFTKALDLSKIKGVYFIGSRVFCEEKVPELQKYKSLGAMSLGFMKPEHLDSEVVIVISTEDSYANLPDQIKSKITAAEFDAIGPEQFKVLKVSKAQVLILNR